MPISHQTLQQGKWILFDEALSVMSDWWIYQS